jgi:hypothetical protein
LEAKFEMVASSLPYPTHRRQSHYERHPYPTSADSSPYPFVLKTLGPPTPAQSGSGHQVSDFSKKKSAMKKRYPSQNSASKIAALPQCVVLNHTQNTQFPRNPNQRQALILARPPRTA